MNYRMPKAVFVTEFLVNGFTRNMALTAAQQGGLTRGKVSREKHFALMKKVLEASGVNQSDIRTASEQILWYGVKQPAPHHAARSQIAAMPKDMEDKR